MLRGIYTSATGMMAELERQNTVANNLANVNTTGFKKDNVTSVPFADMFLHAFNKDGPRPVGTLGLGVEAVTRFVNFSNGIVHTTGNPFDLALQGPGLFAVETERGLRYTRAGNFTIDNEGYLTTIEGYKVQGQRGAIRLGAGDFRVTENGEIIQNDHVLDQLLVFDHTGMVKEGEYFYTAESIQPAVDYRIHQGALEKSNINSVYEMINMITASRNYETNQRALTAHDETLAKVVNDMAR